MPDLLLINGYRVDLKDDDQAGFTKAANDLGDMQSRQGSYSYTIRLPKSDNNRNILENAHVLTSATRLPYQKLRCDYYADGVQLIGDGVGVIQDAGQEFNLNIYSSNAGLFQLIDGKKLEELDLSAFDLTWEHSNIVACYGNSITPVTMLIDDGTLSETAREIDSKKMYFHAYLHDIFKQILADAGYTYSGSLFTDLKYTKAVFPFVNEYPRQGLTEINNSSASASEVIEVYGVGTTVELNVICTDDSVDGFDTGSNYDNVTGEYTVPYAGRVKVSGHFVTDAIWSGVVTSLNADVIVKKNGVVASTIDAYTSSTVNANDNNFTDFETLIDCQAGDVLSVHFKYTQLTSQFNIGLKLGGNTTGGETFISFILDEELLWGGEWHIARNLPDMTQKDFFKMVCNLFGQSFYVDDFAKNVNFFTIDEVIESKGAFGAQDWSEYYDSGSHSVKFHSRFAKSNDCVFTEDDEVPKFTGDGKFTVDDATLSERSQAFKLPVAASIEVKRLRGIDMAQVLRVDVDGNDITPKPRILRFTSQPFPAPSVNDYVRIQESGTGNINDFFTAYTGRFDYNLNTIIEEYYQGWIQVLNDYKAVTAMFKLPAYVVTNLDFAQAVYVRELSSWFYVNKIENYKSGKKCKVELQQV